MYNIRIGTFIATCAFDKTLNLFDFFSGELVAQVSGHSELMTSVRFSPDGKFILSVGGDGCILKWSLDDYITNSIQERLLELEMKLESKSGIQLPPKKMKDRNVSSVSPINLVPPLDSLENEGNFPPPPPHSERMEEEIPIGTSTETSTEEPPQIISDIMDIKHTTHISENWLEDMVSAKHS